MTPWKAERQEPLHREESGAQQIYHPPFRSFAAAQAVQRSYRNIMIAAFVIGFSSYLSTWYFEIWQ